MHIMSYGSKLVNTEYMYALVLFVERESVTVDHGMQNMVVRFDMLKLRKYPSLNWSLYS